MSWLLDTNVLLRLADAQSTEHTVAEAAIEHLIVGEESVFICTQVLVEFWAVATRPESASGLGWSTATTVEAIRAPRRQFPLLNEAPEVLDRWFDLVDRFQVAGKHARRPIGSFAARAWGSPVTDVQHGRLSSGLGCTRDAPIRSSPGVTGRC
jgi:predicted nucleic acid-binding protein